MAGKFPAAGNVRQIYQEGEDENETTSGDECQTSVALENVARDSEKQT